jgi:hypothetical protein
MIQVLTPNNYVLICNEISKIEEQSKLHGYLDSLDAMYSPTHPLFWLLLYNQLSELDQYDTESDMQRIWIDCSVEAPELDYYASAINPAIRYAKVYSAYKEYEADMRSINDHSDTAINPKGYIKEMTSFSSLLTINDQLAMHQFLMKEKLIVYISEENFLSIFSNQIQKSIKVKIKWNVNNGGKYYNESLFMFLHKMCKEEYNNLALKKEYYFKILENFDLTADGNKSQPEWEALKSAYSKWKNRIFKGNYKDKIDYQQLDKISYDIYQFEATDTSNQSRD